MMYRYGTSNPITLLNQMQIQLREVLNELQGLTFLTIPSIQYTSLMQIPG